MATAIGCDLCETEPAIMMQTSLANGDTMSVGQACLLVFTGSSFAAMLANTDADTRAMYGKPLTDLIERIVERADMLAYFGGAAFPDGNQDAGNGVIMPGKMAEPEMAAGFTQAVDDLENAQE